MELHPIGESAVTLAAPLGPPQLVNAGSVGTETDALSAVFELPIQSPPPRPPEEHFVGASLRSPPEYAPSSPEAPSDHA